MDKLGTRVGPFSIKSAPPQPWGELLTVSVRLCFPVLQTVHLTKVSSVTTPPVGIGLVAATS